MIWTFDEPFNNKGQPGGVYYPNVGPCDVVQGTWTCRGIGLGYTGTASASSKGLYFIWAVVVNTSEAFRIVHTIRCLASPLFVNHCSIRDTSLPGEQIAGAQKVGVKRIY